MKKIFLLILGVIILIVIIIFVVLIVSSNQLNKDLESKGLVGIGKVFSVQVIEESDYNILNDNGDFDLWVKSERYKMIEYMKEKNLKLKSGMYEINQAATFEKALEIFEFK